MIPAENRDTDRDAHASDRAEPLSAEVLARRLERERRAREQAEALLESKALELYEANADLGFAAEQLARRVSDLEAERATIKRMAQTDPLTGLLNRAALIERLEAILAQPRTRSGAVLTIDLDAFKTINSYHGHSAGDAALQEAALRIQRVAARVPGVEVARMGGDEFLILAPGVHNAGDALAIAISVREALDAPASIFNRRVKLSGSLGVAFFPEHGASFHEIYNASALSLARAKEVGLPIQLFNDEIARAAALADDLKQAILDNQLEPWLQPILLGRKAGPVSFEMLARWRHPQRGLISPADFIPLAERNGLIGDLSTALLQSASDPLREALRDPRVDYVALNVSMTEFQEAFFAERLLDTFALHRIPPARVMVELTESSFSEDIVGAQEHIETLRKAEVRVALDDFGTGYSNLRALADMPITTLKFDRSLIANVGSDARASRLFGCAVDLARTLQLNIVAEGIETSGQAAFAQALGCDYYQGYFFSQPMPIASAVALIESGALSGAEPRKGEYQI